MKDLIPKTLLGIVIIFLSSAIGFVCGQSSLNSTISIQDMESVQKISGVSSISIYNWYGKWEIQFDLETKCGKTRVKSGNHSTLKEAIAFAKVGASCFDSCGGK